MSSDYSARSRQFREALEDALADQQSPVATALLISRLSAIVRRCRHLDIADETVSGALEALAAVVATPDADAALSEAAARFESPQRFRETLFFARCLERDPSLAGPLMEMRAYLGAATVPDAAFPSLAAEQAQLLGWATFEALWRDAGRFHEMREGIGRWHQAYIPAYLARHTAYHAALAGVLQQIEEAQWQADLLQRLNGLAKLGAPQGAGWLTRYREMEQVFRCPATTDELREALRESPVCPHCEFRLTDSQATDDTERVLAGIVDALTAQNERLERRVVSRLIGAGGTPERRVAELIGAVQARDFHAMYAVLDEGLTEFVSDLLDTPDETPGLLATLAQAFPEVTEDNVEEVTAAFGQLLRTELVRRGGRLSLEAEDA